MFTHLCIDYADSTDHTDVITVKYKLFDHSLVPLWVERVLTAQQAYSIDDPARFYGMTDNEQAVAIEKINACIDTINQYKSIITRRVTDVKDSDTLNYLHHIFEVYHGLLDQQTHEYYISAPEHVKKALADLNICVHRCESVARMNRPRHVVTYFGLPKTKLLKPEHYDLFTDVYEFGTVYLNYVEIGKTLEDLTMDNDQYIGQDAFKPYRYYSADFSVVFDNSRIEDIFARREKIKQFYFQNLKFFIDRGYHINHPHLRPGRIPLAKIDTDNNNILQSIKRRQFVKSVYFI